MKLISEQWSDDVNYLVEEDPKTGKKNMFIEGIMLQTEVKNKNGRIYPLEVMKKAFASGVHESDLCARRVSVVRAVCSILQRLLFSLLLELPDV